MTENATNPAQARPWIKKALGIPHPNTLRKPKKNGYNGLILTERGDGELYDVTHLPVVKRDGGGLYKKEAHARYWLNKPIPAGWLTIWVEADPEPVSHREPIGYGPKTLDVLTGSYIVHALGGGLQGQFKVKGWMMWLIGGAIAIAAIVALYVWYRGKYGA
jgi:hypothetical protein